MRAARSNTRGFSLIEMAIVLAVAGAIIVGIWSAGAMVSSTGKTTNAVTQLQLVVDNMIAYAASGYGTFNPPANGTNITAAMIAAGVIPNWAVSAANPAWASNPWSDVGNGGGGFTMTWTPPGPLPIVPRSVRIVFYQVSHSGCLGLLLQGTACAKTHGCPIAAYTAVEAQTCNLAAGCSMTSAQAAAMCNANDYFGGAANSVEFDYQL